MSNEQDSTPILYYMAIVTGEQIMHDCPLSSAINAAEEIVQY